MFTFKGLIKLTTHRALRSSFISKPQLEIRWLCNVFFSSVKTYFDLWSLQYHVLNYIYHVHLLNRKLGTLYPFTTDRLKNKQQMHRFKPTLLTGGKRYKEEKYSRRQTITQLKLAQASTRWVYKSLSYSVRFSTVLCWNALLCWFNFLNK